MSSHALYLYLITVSIQNTFRPLANYGLNTPPTPPHPRKHTHTTHTQGNFLDHVFLKAIILQVFCSMLAIWRRGRYPLTACYIRYPYKKI